MEKNVGFWKEKMDKGWYPDKIVWTAFPVANSATGDQTVYLEALDRIEQKAARVDYLGGSSCRICGCMNGCSEFTYKGFRWPSGYSHYLRDHHVAIDAEFAKMLLAEK